MNLILIILAVSVPIGILLYILGLLLLQLKIVNRLTETNKQLLIIVAGKEDKPEPALRALIASEKLPKKKISGIATGKKDDRKKPLNTDYTLTIGEKRGI